MMGPSPFTPAQFDAIEAVKGQPETASNLTRAAKQFGEDVARWAFEQWSLRKRARAKFAKADEMLFDREGLEMATHEELARYHASRFPPGELVADLTAGIGADLIALAARGPVVGFELDPIRAAIAQHNLSVHALEAELRVADCLQIDWGFRFAFADPSRRSNNGRLSDPDDFSPNPRTLMNRMEHLEFGLMKLSPMLTDDYLASLSTDREFVSFQGECREALLLLGKQGSDEIRAIQLGVGTLMGETELPKAVEEPLSILFEADPAAIRAHALGDVCARLGAYPLGDSNGYLTGSVGNADQALDLQSWAKSFEVHSYGRLDEKRIRTDLRRLQCSLESVKVRGVPESPEKWMRLLDGNGLPGVVLILYPVGPSSRYVIAKPMR